MLYSHCKMKSPGLFDISEDLLYLIVARLNEEFPSSVLPFAEASKACNRLATPVLYHSIVIRDEGPKTDISRLLMERLLVSDHEILQHVRDLTIEQLGKNPDVLSFEKVERVVRNVKHLTSFR